MEQPSACSLCDEEVYPPCDEFGPAVDREHMWRHVEHIASACPCVTPPGQPQSTCVDLLRANLVSAAWDLHAAQLAIRRAFPDKGQGLDAACTTAVTTPFLLHPDASRHAAGRAPGSFRP